MPLQWKVNTDDGNRFPSRITMSFHLCAKWHPVEGDFPKLLNLTLSIAVVPKLEAPK